MNLKLTEYDAISKAKQVLSKYDKIFIAYSGGADSELLLTLFSKYGLIDKHKIKLVFYDTGIEYQATKQFIQEKESQGHEIVKIYADKPVPYTVKMYGQPFISKRVSEMLNRLQTHGFDFKNHINLSYPELEPLYPNCKIALKWITNFYGSKNDTIENQKKYDIPSKSIGNIARNKYLKEFLIQFGLPFKVSAKCCYYAKKKTSHKFVKDNNMQLNIIGIRKSEGGARAVAYKGCYIKRDDIDLYLPIFWFSNENVEQFIKENNVKLSDCYTRYGLKRTGCAGCPFGKNVEQEREVLRKYEPQLSKAIEHIFKDTYNHTRRYKEFVKNKKRIEKTYFKSSDKEFKALEPGASENSS